MGLVDELKAYVAANGARHPYEFDEGNWTYELVISTSRDLFGPKKERRTRDLSKLIESLAVREAELDAMPKQAELF